MNPDAIGPVQHTAGVELAKCFHCFSYGTLALTSLFFLAACLSLMLVVKRAISAAGERTLRLRSIVFVVELPLLVLYVRVFWTLPLSNDPFVILLRCFLVLSSMPLAFTPFVDQLFPERLCSPSRTSNTAGSWSATSHGLRHRSRLLAFQMALMLLVQDGGRVPKVGGNSGSTRPT